MKYILVTLISCSFLPASAMITPTLLRQTIMSQLATEPKEALTKDLNLFIEKLEASTDPNQSITTQNKAVIKLYQAAVCYADTEKHMAIADIGQNQQTNYTALHKKACITYLRSMTNIIDRLGYTPGKG